MCYPKPGPRCSKHAKDHLRKAVKAYKKNPSLDARENLQEARDQFDATPEGIAELEKQIEKTPGDERLSERLEAGKARRKMSLDALKLSRDYGDVDDTSKKWAGALILEEAHQAGVAAEKAARERGDDDLVDVNPLGDLTFSVAGHMATRKTDFSLNGQQSVIIDEKSIEPIKDTIKALHKETVKEQPQNSPGWWRESMSLRSTPYSYSSYRGDAYNAAFAQTLQKHGVNSHNVTASLPENPEEVYRQILDKRKWASHGTKSTQAVAYSEEYGDALRAMQRIREDKDVSNEQIYSSMRTLAQEKISEFSRAGEEYRKQAWQEVETVLRWSAARYRREHAASSTS